MEVQNRHIIGKQVVLLQLSSAAHAFELKQQVSRLFWDTVAPALEALFDQYAHADELISIEKLQVDIGLIPDKNWEQTFAKVLLESIESALRKQVNNNGNPSEVIRQPLRTGYFHQWLHFLEFGYLPWNASAGNSDEVLQKGVLDTLASETSALPQLRSLLSQYPLAFDRLVLQHPEAFLKTLTAIFTARPQEELLSFRQEWTSMLRGAKKSNRQIPPIIAQWLTGQAPESPSFFWKNILKIVVVEGRQLAAPSLIGVFLERLAPANQLPAIINFIEQALGLQTSGQPMAAVKNALATFIKKIKPTKEAFLDNTEPALGAEAAEEVAPQISVVAETHSTENQVVLKITEAPKELFLEKAESDLGTETPEAIAPQISEVAQIPSTEEQVVLKTAEAPKELFLEKTESALGAETTEAVALQISEIAKTHSTEEQVVIKTTEALKESFLEKAESALGAETAEAVAPQISEVDQTHSTEEQVVIKTAEAPKELFLEKAESTLGGETGEAVSPRISEVAETHSTDEQVVIKTAEPPKEAFLEKSESALWAENAEASAPQILEIAETYSTDEQVVLKTAESPKELFLEKTESALSDETVEATAPQISEVDQTPSTEQQVVLKTTEVLKESFLEKAESDLGAETTKAITPQISEVAETHSTDEQVVFKTAESPKEAFLEKAESDLGAETGEATAPQISEVDQTPSSEEQIVLKTAEARKEAFLEKAESALGAETAEVVAPQISEVAQTPSAQEQVVLETAEPTKEAFLEKAEPALGAETAEVAAPQIPEVAETHSAEQQVVLKIAEVPKAGETILPVNDRPSIGEETTVSEKSSFANVETVQPSPAPKRPPLEIQEGTTLFINYAGMVLLHPYLPHFFKGLGLVEANNFKDDTCRHRAVHLLHYLVTKETGLPEFVLLLPKLLCGLPFEEPMERYFEFSETEVAECENLLDAVVQHWGALGKSSPDALREGFLRRDGKLEKRESGWHLTVERQTIDILLDRLPWGLGIIKLPWMEEILRVEWR